MGPSQHFQTASTFHYSNFPERPERQVLLGYKYFTNREALKVTGWDGTEVKGFINKCLFRSLYPRFLEHVRPTRRLSARDHTVPVPLGSPGCLPSHLRPCWLRAGCPLPPQPQGRGCPSRHGPSPAPLLASSQPLPGLWAVGQELVPLPWQVPATFTLSSAGSPRADGEQTNPMCHQDSSRGVNVYKTPTYFARLPASWSDAS